MQTLTDEYLRLAPVGDLYRRYASLKRRGDNTAEADRIKAEIERRIRNQQNKKHGGKP
jgi:hypothetical protein